jgi:hypothetical protein
MPRTLKDRIRAKMVQHTPQGIVVKQDQDEVVPAEVMAQAIVDIGRAMKALSGSRLNARAVRVLLHDATGLPMRSIKAVIDALNDLERIYLKPKV